MIHTVVSLCSPLFATGALWIGKWGGKVREGAEERLESRMNTLGWPKIYTFYMIYVRVTH
jgi:hypothetical protein